MPSPLRQLYILYIKGVDLTLLVLALALNLLLGYSNGDYLNYGVQFATDRIKVSNAILIGVTLFCWHHILNSRGLYTLSRLHRFREEIREITAAVALCTGVLLVVAQIGRWQTIRVWLGISFACTSCMLIFAFRLIQQYILGRARRKGHNLRSILVIGAGPRGQQFVSRLAERPDLGYDVIGFVDSPQRGKSLPDIPWLGDLAALPQIVADRVIDEVVVALPIKSHYESIESTISLLEEQGIAVHLLSDFFESQIANAQPARLQGMNFISLHSSPRVGWHVELKRLLDIVGAAFLLVLLSPVFLLAAILVKLESSGPVFFVQERMGYNKRRFLLFKFRTMCVDAEARMKEIEHLNEKDGPIFKIKNDPRITRVGKWLRKTSIDELPQLVNVVLGDMSLVGPRPLSIRDALGMNAAWQKRRFSVKPGITCLWQVSGRSNLSFKEWMLLDLEYIDRWSLVLDFLILLRTIPAVLLGRGAA